MEQKEDAKELLEVLDRYIRPITFPVAVKFKKEKVDFPGRSTRPKKDLGHPIAVCQGVALARRLGWNIIFKKEDHACPIGEIVMGHAEPDELLAGNAAYPYYAETQEIAQKMEEAFYSLPIGSIEELWLSPLHKAEFYPDVVLVYGNAAQVARMAQGANYSTGKGIDSKTFGREACSFYFARSYIEKQCSLVVTSGGERAFANAMDDELIFSIPSGYFKLVAEGIKAVQKQGLSRFPTFFHGMPLEPVLPPKYRKLTK